MTRKPTLYIYAPDGTEAAHELMADAGLHIPREGELVYASDHTGDNAEAFSHDEMWRVTEVQTEFRLVENMNGGGCWQQLVYVRTEEQDE